MNLALIQKLKGRWEVIPRVIDSVLEVIGLKTLVEEDDLEVYTSERQIF